MRKLRHNVEMVLIIIQILCLVSLAFDFKSTLIFVVSKFITFGLMLLIHNVLVKYGTIYN